MTHRPRRFSVVAPPLSTLLLCAACAPSAAVCVEQVHLRRPPHPCGEQVTPQHGDHRSALIYHLHRSSRQAAAVAP